MGCASSNDAAKDGQDHISTVCWKEETVTRTITSFNYNEAEVDITHFSKGNEALGLGGFGIVRRAKKLSGKDKGTEYAMKSMSKDAIIRRTSGPSAVSTELKCLILLSNCKFVCQLHYAFQSPTHLFMVLELARGGDLRHCLRATPKSRFSEDAAKYLICQILLGLDYCHQASILHRGTWSLSSCIFSVF